MDDARANEVIRGLRSGEPDAWRMLYDAYAERVWHSVARWIGPFPADVADVVQEAMLAAARSARNFDPAKGDLWQWLRGIARTQVQLHYRKEHRHERWKQLPQRAVAPTDDPLEHAELAEMVRSTLADLPGDYDALLTAKYLDGESVGAIAARERLTETAVRSKLARARAAFRSAFAQPDVKAGGRRPPV